MRPLTSKQIEEQIQKLMKKKAEAIERENRFNISIPTMNRIKEVLNGKGVELTEGEMDHIIAPLQNLEHFLQKKTTNKKKED